MYTLRDDINIYVTLHQDLIQNSQQNSEQITPPKTKVARVYKLFLAHAGRKMIAWGYQMYKKSGGSVEMPLITPPYAIENRG